MSSDQNPQPQILWILFFSLLSSLGIYAVISFVVPGGSMAEGAEGGPDVIILYALAGMAVMSFGLSFVLPSKLLPSAPFLTKKILSWALAESIAIYGLVLHFMYGSRPVTLGFIGWAALTMILHGPFSIPGDGERR